jgi:hypothetical protein
MYSGHKANRVNHNNKVQNGGASIQQQIPLELRELKEARSSAERNPARRLGREGGSRSVN